MSKVKISAFTISLDGFGAGLNQSKVNPLGIKGNELHAWMHPTKMFQKMMGKNVGTERVDNDFAEKSMKNIGAWIMGRNMFAPSRGQWSDDGWKGWWGEEPPYHGPTFILTHHAREPIEMKGGTIFYFVTGGIEAALAEAKKAANGKDIRILGGNSTLRQFLQAGYVDKMHFVISPVFLGSGEHLFSGIDMSKLGFNQIQRVEGENGTHIVLTKSNKRKESLIMDEKEIATEFLKMVSSGKVKEAYDKYIHPDFIHHNAYFKGDRETLMKGMKEHAKQFPNKKYETLRTVEEDDLVSIHGKVKLSAGKVFSVIHIFRFKDDKIIEEWEASQEDIKDSLNKNGIF